MDASRFDTLCQIVSRAISRRGLVTSAGPAALSLGGLAALLGDDRVLAKKNKKKRRRKRRKKERRCLKKVPQRACTTNKQCCHKTIKYECGTSHGGGANTCCGKTGAKCSSDLDCCTTGHCNANGRCAPGPGDD